MGSTIGIIRAVDPVKINGGVFMTKMQAMYKWSGGTCWQHICRECKNLIRVEAGKRKVYKCLVYGNTASSATDWKESCIACKYFNKPVPELPLIKTGGKKIQNCGKFPGQLSLFDFTDAQDIDGY